jgi:aspartyl-tRNA(Asn)/glutamyl-tRNA(Gln) amidotransferase subunit A
LPSNEKVLSIERHYNGCIDASKIISMNEAILHLRDGSLTPADLRKACARQIERLNPILNAFITICDPVENPSQGNRAPLEAIPIAIKDMFETKGIRTTAGSVFFEDYFPTEDAVPVKKLLAAGAIMMGKTNTHEFALGVTTANPHYGACRNPWDRARIPGGSSGGSAVAVATGMSLAALGTDTGGSIRIPASLCGVIGLKPTYGRVSVRGVIPLSWNLDHIGPLTRTVKDAAMLLEIIAGYDPDDAFSIDHPGDKYLVDIEKGVGGWRIALAGGDFVEEAAGEVISAVHRAAGVFEKLGANVEVVDMSFLREAALSNSVMTQADGAAFHRERLAEHPNKFGADVRQRLETGRSFTSTDYSLARKTQTETKRRFEGFFEKYRLLLLPSTPIAAPLIEGNDAIEQARQLTRFTAPFNLAGLPALSIPCGFNAEGLPLGLQIIAGAWDESSLLRAANAYEKETTWISKRVPLLAQ